jgi:pimeloyl-ACP methyl ester carboxylesterase
MTLKKIRLAEGEISYLELGIGPDLLFLHGAIATSVGYIPLLTLLSKTYHVMAPIHPGHGPSFSIPKDWKLNDFVRFYQDFLIETGCSPEILLGHSFGGTLALLLAAGGLGGQVIVMDSPGLPFQFELTQYIKALIIEAKGVIDKRPDLGKTLEATKAAGTLFQTLARHPDVLFLFTKEGPKFNIHRELTRITIPVTIFWGEQDHVVPLQIGSVMKQIIPNARLTVFPGLGHNYSVTDPEFTYREIMKVISKKT